MIPALPKFNIRSLSLFLISGALVASLNANAQEVTDPGVSLSLAKLRKEQIREVNYSIRLNIPKDSVAPIKAYEEISFVLRHQRHDLVIDFRESADHLKNVSVNGKVVRYAFEKEHIIIPASQLQRGLNKVGISFIAGNTPLTRRKEYLYTLLVPERARMFIPCFDQPDLKAKFTLRAEVPTDWDVVGNGIRKSAIVRGDRKVMSFEPSDKISTYLFTVVAGKFTRTTRRVDGRELNFYYRETDKERIAESLDSIFILHREAIRFMETYTGIKYPFKKFDFIALSDLAYGGMEHVGAIDYRSPSLFLNKSADLRQRINRVTLIAHETAHMWFGNLLTMKWFNDVWMKEVFANFMADKLVQKLMPGYSNSLSFMMGHAPAAYSVDRTEGTHPIRQELDNLNNAASLYGAIIYNKAPMAMNQLELVTGKEHLQKALMSYLQQYAYGNADWTDLIRIIGNQGASKIKEWNKVWINEAGRPEISFTMGKENNKIHSFIIRQRDPANLGRIWPQSFSVGLVYPDSLRLIHIKLEGESTDIKGLHGAAIPQAVVFNAGGEGYGLFPFDKATLTSYHTIKDPVIRGSSYLNLYENVLNGNVLSPEAFIMEVAGFLMKEDNNLIINQMSAGLSSMYWQFITEKQRRVLAPRIEAELFRAIEGAQTEATKRSLFKLYCGIAVTRPSLDSVHKYWKSMLAPGGISLNEDELTNMACQLAVKDYPFADGILQEQVSRIHNTDRRNRLQYILPSLSSNVSVRDAFFASLEHNRKNEEFIGVALGYLHHPLRQQESQRYLKRSLEWLTMIKASSGIFFPTDWLSATFGSYNSGYAVQTVKDFLKEHPGYDPALKLKILQQSDRLFRSQKIITDLSATR